MIAGKSVVKGFVLAVAAFALSAAAPKTADADNRMPLSPSPMPTVAMPLPQLYIGTPVSIACTNPGSHQDVAKTPSLKNTSGAKIEKGRVLYWKATDGDSGSIKLEADLLPNQAVQVIGKPGNGYQCSSNFLTSPDLTVKKAQFATWSSATIEVQNLDAWVDANPSVTRVEVMSCSGPTLATVDLAPTSFAKGQTKSFSVQFPQQSGKIYLRVRADQGGSVKERNETNNLWDDMDTCIH